MLTNKSKVGKTYVFMPSRHPWYACEVAVLATKGKKLIVARCLDVCDGLLALKGSRKGKLKTWTCVEEDLW